MLKKAFSFMALLCLSGCAVGWGKPYEVEFENSSTITIQYDPLLTSIGKMQAVAQAYCGQTGRDAVPQSTLVSPLGTGVTNVTFACQDR
jgi:hypothetical protein